MRVKGKTLTGKKPSAKDEQRALKIARTAGREITREEDLLRESQKLSIPREVVDLHRS